MAAQPHLKRIMEDRATLTREEARDLMQQVFAGQLTDLDLAALLGALAARSETAAELAGFVDAMRAAATPIPLSPAERAILIDTCGTGGDGSDTFNISTAAALVAAAAGATVAKHGNRAVTSKCGSGDVLEALGIPVSLDPAQAAEALRRHRFAFLHAPSLHPAVVKSVMPVRRALGIRTVFNVIGPLTNPAGAQAQVMGVYSAHLVPLVAETMRLLGIRHAFVVHGTYPRSGMDAASSRALRGLDELSISGPTHIAEVRGSSLTYTQLHPEEVHLRSAPIESLRGGDAAANAAILAAIFAGERGPRRDVVLLNAAAVLITAGLVTGPGLPGALREGIHLAERTIDNGAVTSLVATLRHTPESVRPRVPGEELLC
jgi:anthranilate phosphoribosyltransferase